MSSVYENWEKRFAELVAFREREGHCLVPTGYEKNPSLANWVKCQRRLRESISSERKQRLDQIGFDWNPLESLWEKRFTELVAFKEQEGHCNVPRDYENIPQLFDWVSKQRADKTISIIRKNKLEEIGFEWTPFESLWEKRFAELVAFKEQEGHCNVSEGYEKNPSLALWVATQRGLKEKIPCERKQRLDEIGFDWNPLESSWEKRFAELVAFKEQEGHCNVSEGYEKNPSLALWVHNQRRLWEGISSERKQRLDQIGFDWNPLESLWEKRFAELVAFKEQEGHCNVPHNYEIIPQLFQWVCTQRADKTISIIRKNKLEEIGFEWTPLESLWEKRFAELVAFKKQEGHCNIPADYKINPPLGHWITTQRQSKNTLNTDRRKKLDDIGFEWDFQEAHLEALWEKRFTELVAFKELEGHCNIPASYKQNPPLSRWVASQRKVKKSLRADRWKKLDEIGFEWDFKEAQLEAMWETRFAELVAFKGQEGHCNVPYKYEIIPQLFQWICTQRKMYLKGRLIEERKFRLESLEGWVWSLKDKDWETGSSYLRDYYKVNAHSDVPFSFVTKDGFKLGKWVDKIRSKNNLSNERRAFLNMVQFDFKDENKILFSTNLKIA